VVDDAGEDDWAAEVAAELQQPFPGGGPLVRFVLLRRPGAFDLIMTGEHVLADATSYVYLLRDLLEALGTPDRPVAVHDSPPGWGVLRWRDEDPGSRPEPATEYNTVAPPTEAFGIVHRVWGRELTEALVARCRAEGTTVHAAVATAVLRALATLEEGHPVRRL